MTYTAPALLLATAGLVVSPAVSAQPVTFDFDTGVPPLSTYQSLPIDQTAGGLTASFSSFGDGYSIQTDQSLQFHMSQFSGHYLYPNSLFTGPLEIHFSRKVTSITLTFATSDFQQVEVPTTIKLSAYVGSTTSTAIGSASAHGTYGPDTMPMGTLAFSSATPFDVVKIEIPRAPSAASNFLVDNVVVEPIPASNGRRVSKHLRGTPVVPPV